MLRISAASDRPFSPHVASALPSTAAKENRFVRVFCEGLGGGGDLAGEQMGGLEHNYKVNDLSGVAMAPS